MSRSKQARAHEFSAKDRVRIKDRDMGMCIFCMQQYHMDGALPMDLNVKSIMHYIPRSQGGLGIPENGAVGCQWHHDMMDNGNKGNREEMLGMFREYLQGLYPGWSEENLKYNKWR